MSEDSSQYDIERISQLLHAARHEIKSCKYPEALGLYQLAMDLCQDSPVFSWIYDETLVAHKRFSLHDPSHKYGEFSAKYNDFYLKNQFWGDEGVRPSATSGSGKFKLSVVAIVKNEEKYLLEWIAYHRVIGVDHFLIYNNESTDGTEEILKSLSKAGIVTYLNWPTHPERAAICGLSPQLCAYWNGWSNLFGQSEWIAFIDADEFIMLNRHEEISEFLDSCANFSGIALNWKMFGSSGEQYYHDEPVIKRFTMSKQSGGIKTIAKTEKILCISNHPHSCRFIDSHYYYPDKTSATEDSSKWRHIDYSIALLNHYFTKSREEWTEKRERGMGILDKVGNMKYRSDEEFYSADAGCKTVDTGILRHFQSTIATISVFKKIIQNSGKSVWFHEFFCAGIGHDQPLISPTLPAEELAFIREKLKGRRFMVGYGLNEGALRALDAGVKEVWIVDSRKALLSRARAVVRCLALALPQKPTLELLYGDIGDTSFWGHPENKEKTDQWPRYSTLVWSKLGARSAEVDAVCIQGRFRIASTLISLICAGENSVIFISNFSRDAYKAILEYCVVQERVGGTVTLIKRPETTVSQLIDGFAQYMLDPS